MRVDVLVVKRDDEENEESNARVADAILVRVCVRVCASERFVLWIFT